MGISFYEIANDSRERNCVYARMAYAYFCKEQGATITDIAAEMRRHHSTVIYYLKKFEDDRKFNPKFREIAKRIEIALSITEKFIII
jgi:chromosomal replication initiation ATPase DnaA